MTIARILLLLAAFALLVALPAGAPSWDVPSQWTHLAVIDHADCCGTPLDKAEPCKAVCPAGATVAIGSGFTLPPPAHASGLIPWSARVLASLARAPDTTPPKHSIA